MYMYMYMYMYIYIGLTRRLTLDAVERVRGQVVRENGEGNRSVVTAAGEVAHLAADGGAADRPRERRLALTPRKGEHVGGLVSVAIDAPDTHLRNHGEREIHIYMYTHTHTHIYIHIIYIHIS